MEPKASLPSNSSQQELNAHPSAPTREALVEQVAHELQKLSPLCLAPLKAERHSLLHFCIEEFAEVNEIWKSRGIEAVIARWGEERTFCIEDPNSPKNHIAEPTFEGNYPLTLSVYEFAPDIDPNPVQMAYFGLRRFELSPDLKSEMCKTFEASGALERFYPQADSITHAKLSEAPIDDISCSCELYGPDNIYGDGVVLIITLRLCPPDKGPEELRLSLDKHGVMRRSLWVGELVESGYEGHDHFSSPLLVDEMRVLLPLIAKLHSSTPETPRRCSMGSWLGNSFLTGN